MYLRFVQVEYANKFGLGNLLSRVYPFKAVAAEKERSHCHNFVDTVWSWTPSIVRLTNLELLNGGLPTKVVLSFARIYDCSKC